VPRDRRHTACRAEHGRPLLGDRRPHHAHTGYAISQAIRKRIEEAFGWSKTIAGLGKLHHRGLPKVDWQFTLTMAADNLIRLPKLLAQGAGP
jgi:hypothetical protein